MEPKEHDLIIQLSRQQRLHPAHHLPLFRLLSGPWLTVVSQKPCKRLRTHQTRRT